MNKKISFVCIMILMLSIVGCSNQWQNLGNEFHMETDFPFMYYENFNHIPMAEAPDGYYMLLGAYLFYADKDSMEVLPVCSRPNCLHQLEPDSSKVSFCDAFLGNTFNGFLQYYEGHIYTTMAVNREEQIFEESLVKISLDGTQRTKLKEVNLNSTFAIHRGFLYEGVNSGDGEVLKYSLEEVEGEGEHLYISELEIVTYTFLAKGNYVYLYEAGISQEESYHYEVVCHDLTTGETKLVLEAEGEKQVSLVTSSSDTLLYKKTIPSIYGVTEDQAIYYESDLDGGNERLLRDFSENRKEGFEDYHLEVSLRSDEMYYYEQYLYGVETPFIEHRIIRITDKESNLILEEDLSWFSNFSGIKIGGEEHLFIQFHGRGSYYLYVVEKEEVEKGTFVPELMIEIPWSEVNRGYSLNRVN